MPLYDFACACGRVTESREGINTVLIPCPCGRLAGRVGVYRQQFIHCETGPKGGLKNPVPRDEIRLGAALSEYEEALGEVNYAYDKTDDPSVKQPNYFKEGLKRARRRGAKLK